MVSEINQNENNEISLKELVQKIKEWYQFLLAKWAKILLIGLIGATIGFIYAFMDKPIYKATLTFAMEDDKGGGSGGLSGALGLASSFGIDLGGAGGGGAFAAMNLSELMKSRLIVEKVLLKSIEINGEKTSLVEYYIKINKLRENWDKNPSLKGIQFSSNLDRSKFTFQQDSILGQIYKTLINKKDLIILQKDKKVSILTIEVQSENELFSKLFCENLAKETSLFYIETKSKKAKINVDVLQKQADSVRSELNGAITGVAYEADNVYNLNPALNIRTTPSKRKQIDVQANTAVLSQLVVQLELAKISLRKETPLIQLIDSPILPLEKEKTSKLKSLILGGILGVIGSVLYLVFSQFVKSIMD